METSQKNRETAGTLGNLIEALFDEVSELPFSDGAKTALVMIMLGDILKREGRTIYFTCPPLVSQKVAAA